MRGSNTSDRPSVHPNFTLDLNSIDKELHNSLCIYHLFLWRKVWWEHALLWLSISSIIPYKDITVSPQEKIKPVSVSTGHHPLVNQGIRVTHDDRWFVQVLSIQLRSLCHLLTVKWNSVTMGWRKKHTVDCRLVLSFNLELLSLKIFLHNQSALG